MKPVIGLVSGKEISIEEVVESLGGEYEASGLMAEPVDEDQELEALFLEVIEWTLDDSGASSERKAEIMKGIEEFMVADRINDNHIGNMQIIFREVCREVEDAK